MTADFILIMILAILNIILIFDSFGLTKLIQTLFMMREGDKLACSIYCNIIDEIMNVKSIRETIEKNSKKKENITGYITKIDTIIKANIIIESKLYRILNKRGIISKYEKDMKDIKGGIK